MKSLAIVLATAIQFASTLMAADQNLPILTESQVTEVRQQLESFAKGRTTLEEITADSDSTIRLISYFASHKNDVTIKMKLPVAKSFAVWSDYPMASRLAQDYVNVYSNDWRGWRVLGGAKLMLKSYEDGVTALANAVRLGDDKNYIPLGATALSINRMDVFDNLLLPRLLNAINDPSRFSEDDCLDMRRLLIAYAVRQDKEDVFVKAISNLDARAILGKSDFQDAVSTGCAKFKSKQAESLCRQLNVDPTNTVEGVQR